MAGYLPAKRHCKHASGTLGADELRFEGEETPFACGKMGFLPPQTPPSSPKPAFYSTRSFLRRSGHALRLPFGLCRRERAQPFRRRGVLVDLSPGPPTPSPARFYRTVWRYWGAGVFLLSHVSRKNLFASLEICLRFCFCRSVFVREQIKFLEYVIFEKGEMRGGGTAPPGPK